MGSTQINVGDYEISVVDDHIGLRRNPADVFVEVTSAEWDPHRDYALTPDGLWEAQWRGHLIRRSDGRGDNILVDTGMGPGPYEHGPPQGDLLTNLKILGVNASDVNNVVTTHCHGDHIGWNMQGTGASASTTFPNATYHVAKNDWTFYSDPANQNDVFDAQVAPLKSTGQLNFVLGGLELMDGVTLLPTNGHTPGHQCVLVQSGGETAVITGDLFHNIAQIREQHWCPVFDWRTDLSTASRRWLLWRAISENWTVVSGHLPTGMSIGKVVEEDGKPTWLAV